MGDRRAQPDLGAALEHRDDHDVGHPDRADQQRDRAQPEKQGVERAAIHGGTAIALPRDDGGLSVTVTIPSP